MLTPSGGCLRKVGLGVRMFVAGSALVWTAAAAPRWRLSYVPEPDAACPEEAELRQAVAARLGWDPFSADGADTVVARINQRGDGFSGSVELLDEAGASRGRRALEARAATCSEMARALAISISIAVDPDHALDVETPVQSADLAPKPEPAVPAPTTSEPSQRADVAPRRSDPREHESALSVAAVSMWGVAPALAWGGTLRFQKRFAWLALGGGMLGLASPSARISTTESLRSTLAAGNLEACMVGGVLEGCLVGLAGATWARADDVAQPRTDAGAFVAAGGRLALMTPLSSSVSFFADASVLGIAAPVRAAVDGVEIWRAPPVAVALALGTKFHFL